MLDLSVVIATYNRGDLLLRLLENLAGQTLDPKHFEVIVVDDGSKVPAKQSLEGHKWPFAFSLIRQENAGAAAARHNGIMASKGAVIVVVDDDMQLQDDFLEKHLVTQKQGYDVVLGRIIQADNFADMPLHNRFQQHQFNRSFEEWSSKEQLDGAVVYTGNVSFTREIYDKAGGFDLSLKQAEDRELGIRFEKAGGKIRFSSEAIAVNGSDHTDFERWMESSRRYGVHDWQISRQHDDVISVDPFHFLFLVNPISTPFLTTALVFPKLAPTLSRSVMAAANLVNKYNLEKLALSGTTLAFGIQYYQGVRDEAGSLSAVWQGWRQFIKKRSS